MQTILFLFIDWKHIAKVHGEVDTFKLRNRVRALRGWKTRKMKQLTKNKL